MAYETPIAGSGISSQTRGGYAAFKINSRKKRGRGLRKAVMKPEPRENPAQNDHLNYRESPWAFIIKMEPLKK
jgi:hypothetical protein